LNPTAAAIALGLVTMMMSTSAESNSTLTASPTAGSAPLAVTFTGTGSGVLEGVMLLDFGDGTTDNSISTIRGFTRTHTYVVAGSYTARLNGGAYGGQSSAVLETLASVTINVE
jgi:PKD repeat protein